MNKQFLIVGIIQILYCIVIIIYPDIFNVGGIIAISIILIIMGLLEGRKKNE